MKLVQVESKILDLCLIKILENQNLEKVEDLRKCLI